MYREIENILQKNLYMSHIIIIFAPANQNRHGKEK